MSAEQLFEQIEGVKFSAFMNVASSFRVFQSLLEEDEMEDSLIRHLQNHPEDRQKVYERLVTLLDASNQPEYAHPHDTALAGYLYALSRTDPVRAVLAAQLVLETPKLWWAKRLAAHMLERTPKTTSIQLDWGGRIQSQTTFSSLGASVSYLVKIARVQRIARERIENWDYRTGRSVTLDIRKMVM